MYSGAACTHVVSVGARSMKQILAFSARAIGMTIQRVIRVLTVELSGAHAEVWAWHFIFHASAPARC
jgi:hypothetical protein